MLFKLTGSYSLQLCHLFGRCTAGLFSSVSTPLHGEFTHVPKTDVGRNGAGTTRFSGTWLPSGEANPPRSATSLPLPRPYHLAAPSPAHTIILATSQAPQNCLQLTLSQPWHQ